MTRKMTDREKKYLRELVGDDGKGVHYFIPGAFGRHKRSSGNRPTSSPSKRNVQQQVEEMRRCATPPAELVSIIASTTSVAVMRRERWRRMMQP